jgi:hypothetical protein
MQFLTERDAQIAAIVCEIGWRTVARSDEQMTDVKFAYLTFCQRDRPEAAWPPPPGPNGDAHGRRAAAFAGGRAVGARGTLLSDRAMYGLVIEEGL